MNNTRKLSSKLPKKTTTVTLTQGNFVQVYPREVGGSSLLERDVPAQEDLTQTQVFLSQNSSTSACSSEGTVSRNLFTGKEDDCTFVGTNTSPLKKIKRSSTSAPRSVSSHSTSSSVILSPRPKNVNDFNDIIPTSLWVYEMRTPEYTGKIKASNYFKYLQCQDYIQSANHDLVLKIRRWRKKVLKVLYDIKLQGENYYPAAAYTPQFEWTNEVAAGINEGLSCLKMFPAHILNTDALMEVIPEVDDEEKAIFVKKMASCKKYELVYVPFKHLNNFYIYTKFDDMDNKKYAFGKADGVVDLSNICRNN